MSILKVYDFDKTIYDGDSTLDFYKFCIKKKPWVFFYVFIQIISLFKYKLGRLNKLSFKQEFYGFLNFYDNTDILVELFWEQNLSKVKGWYLKTKAENDLIISASPEFLLKPICKKIGIKYLIASKVDIKTGECLSENCYGTEKVKRFMLEFGNEQIEEFYSDSLSDSPMANLSKKSFIVKKNQILDWKTYNPQKLKTEFSLFLIIGVINTFNGTLSSYILTFIFNYNIAFILGYLISLTISYVLNTKLNFKINMSIKGYVKFCISYIPNFVIQFLAVNILFEIFKWNILVVYLVAAILGVPLTFILLKIFAFKNDIKV